MAHGPRPPAHGPLVALAVRRLCAEPHSRGDGRQAAGGPPTQPRLVGCCGTVAPPPCGAPHQDSLALALISDRALNFLF